MKDVSAEKAGHIFGTMWDWNGGKLPACRPGSGAPPCRCFPGSPPSWAGRCRSAGRWLCRRRRSVLCTLTARQSPASSPRRNPPPGRTRRRISAWACWGCRNPRCGKKVALPQRLTSFFIFIFPACTDAQSRSFSFYLSSSPPSVLPVSSWTAAALSRFRSAGGRTVTKGITEITPTAAEIMEIRLKKGAAEATSATIPNCLLIRPNEPAS